MSSSDDDGDIVVMQVCAGVGCAEQDGLVFDVGTGEHLCPLCREKRQLAANGQYELMLSNEDSAAVRLIFEAFDKARRGAWGAAEWNAYSEATGSARREVATFDTNEALAEYMEEEYGAELVAGPAGPVVTLATLRHMYGGYALNGIAALRQDLEALEEGGVGTAALE